MSTASDRSTPTPPDLADATVEFVVAFDAWMQKASMANAGERVARLRLLYELHCNGPRKMAELADTMGVTPRNITALVDGLEAEGMVRRAPHPTDRRVTMIEITGGSASVERQFAALQSAVVDLFAGVSDEDRAVFARVLDSVRGRLEAATR
jgi:DNA-binding MarR family transcriptional regulator